MNFKYVLSQIFVVIAFILLGIGFRKEKKIQILTYSCIFQLFLIVSYSLLNGVMGIISCIISLFRNILFMFNEKKNIKNSNIVLIVFVIITIILTIVFYKSLIDIFPCIITLIGIYSFWNKNTKVTRIGNIIVGICSIIYAIPLKSWLLIVCQIYLIISTIIGFIKYDINKREKNNK